MLSAQFKKSLNPLILKNYVIEYEASPHQNAHNSSRFEKQRRSVVLTAHEQLNYKRYLELTKAKSGVFFHVFDGTSKYRLFFKAIEDQLKSGKSAVVIFPEVNMTFSRMEMLQVLW
jgi:primosomal protein N' (replication factor Y)